MSHSKFLCKLILLSGILLLTGCDKEPPAPIETNVPSDIGSSPVSVSVPNDGSSAKISGLFPATVLETTAPGELETGNTITTIDYSNSNEGYFTVTYNGSNDKVKFQVTGPDGITYTYNILDQISVFPLTKGSGPYKLALYEHAYDSEYTTAFSDTIEVNITDEYKAFLYPSTMVSFNKDSDCVSKATELLMNCDNELSAVETVFGFVMDELSYDYDLAETATGSYIPYPDTTLANGKGICSDYATLMAAMLRSHGIATRLEVGYFDDEYHEWVSIHTEENGWIEGIIHFDGSDWILMDPTISDSLGVKEDYKLITSGEHYTVKYTY